MALSTSEFQTFVGGPLLQLGSMMISLVRFFAAVVSGGALVVTFNANAAQAPAPHAAACEGASEIANSVAITPAPAVVPTLALGDRVELKLRDVTLVTGICAPKLTGFRMGQLFFGARTAVQISGDRVLPLADGDAEGFDAVSPREAPLWPRGQFVMASRVSVVRTDGGLAEAFVGLWQKRGAWTVAAFMRSPKGAYTQPTIVLTSRDRLRSVSYFPGVDSPSGRLGVTQDASNGVRLISLDWRHADLNAQLRSFNEGPSPAR